MSLKDGMTELVTTLSQRLTGDCRLNTSVQSVTASDGGYCLKLTDGSTIQARNVVMAVPAFIAADLLADCAPDAVDVLNQIRYVSTGTVSLAFKRSEIDLPYNGFGLVIPRSEGRNINAITITSTKFNHRAPEGYVLLRAFFGGSRRPEMMEHDDDLLLKIVQQELRSIMGIKVEPLFHRIFRWHRSNPQYDVGHLDRVDAIEAASAARPLCDRQPLPRRRHPGLCPPEPDDRRQTGCRTRSIDIDHVRSSVAAFRL